MSADSLLEGDVLTLDSAPDALTLDSTHLAAGESLIDDSVLDTLTPHSDPSSTNLPEDPLTLDSVLDTLTVHSALPDAHDDGDSLTRDSVLDTLMIHSEPIVVGLDWERDGWRVSYGGATCTKMSRTALLDEPFDDADLVIVEQAHMKERNVYSVAQVYTADELRRMACRSKVKLFPGMPGQLARAARAVGNISDEVNDWGAAMPDKSKDAETMALYAARHPEKVATWKPLRVDEDDPSRRLWPARDALRENLREALNPLRSAWNAKSMAERYGLPEVDKFCALLSANYDKLPDGVKAQFGIERKKLTLKTGEPTRASLVGYGIRVERMSAALTVFLAVYTRDGALRTHPDTGNFIGVRFILDAIGMSSSYRPNMARSQLTHHGMRHYKGGRDGGFRSEYMRNLRHFIQFLRDASESLIADSVLDTLTSHSDPSVSGSGGDSLTRDSVLDTLTSYSEPADTYTSADEVADETNKEVTA